MTCLARCLQALSRSERPQPDDLSGAFEELMDGEASSEAIAGFLMGLAALGETPTDIAAGARVMRARMTRITAPEGAIDTCGTGGDGKGAYNISTAAAIVAAGAGAIVAKHGNRAASSKSGSSDVLGALGLELDCPAERVERSLTEAGAGFLYAPAHHSAVRHVGPARQALGVRTIFNLLGPISNPAGVKRQLLGVYDKRWLVPMAEALRDLGCVRALVICGQDGMDEITTTTLTDIAELKDGDIRCYTFDPAEAGIPRVSEADLKGGDAAHNAEAINRLLAGATGAFRDIVLLNAGAALVVAGKAETIAGGAELAAGAIDDGRARATLDRMIAISRGE
ncbi:anthranilate phosphoribosyltransferase [Maricaulis parjimensis]|uniref:anthranilate phosphoribosyltransferase n=1 Tax=Maricaulis parjimensis TaxID=144023 RepID=UPI0019397BBE|nr:anthranilate phosphoribosyltransferase [Maricaulis parjimensis]